MVTVLAAVILTVLGLAVGSFLNVVIYRVPRGESIASPPSACPNCGHAVRWKDNIPVVSWLVLRGRCRDCQWPIPRRYVLVEVANAAVWWVLAIWAVSTDSLGLLPWLLVLASACVALTIIDLEHFRLPTRSSTRSIRSCWWDWSSPPSSTARCPGRRLSSALVYGSPSSEVSGL